MIKSFLKSQSGAAAVEAVFILPFLCVLYFGMQDLTALITFNRRITATAATISDTVAQYQTTIARPTIVDTFNAVGMIMSPTPASDVHVDVFGYYLKNGAPTLRWQVNSTGGPACNAPDTSNFAGLMASGNDLVVGVSCMSYAPFVAQFLGSNLIGPTTFLLNQTITSRPRSTLTLTCVTVPNGAIPCTS
jgi:Flp pilus assembly protein TadG